MKDNAKSDASPALQFVALSLRDGLDAERVYHENAEGDMAPRFLRALRTGQIDAIGFLSPRYADDLPVLVPAQFWDHCQIDWDMAELRSGGFHFVELRILMSTLVFDHHHLFYSHHHVTELAPFAPSDAKRDQIGITVRHVAPVDIRQRDIGVPRRSTGRPSFKTGIIASFSAMEKNLNWTEKQLAAAVRDRLKADIGKTDDKGLGDDAILKHVRPFWQDMKKNPPRN